MPNRRAADRNDLERMLGTVGDAMTATVVFVTPDMELGTAARLLEKAGVSGAPVLDEGRVVGVVTLQDVLTRIPVPDSNVQTTGPFHRWERALNELSHRTATFVGDVCSRHAVTVRATAPLAAAASLMAAARVNRLPVVDEDGDLAGVIARDDVVRVVAHAFEEAGGRPNKRIASAAW